MNDLSDLRPLADSMRALQDAFLASIEPHRAAFWRYCYRLTGSPWDAEDLVQEALARALGRLSSVWQPTEPRAYLFRIASNTWIDGMRKAGDANRARVDVEASPDLGGSDPSESVAALEHLAAALPRSQAVVVLLVDVFDFRLAEVAEMLNVTTNSVKGLLQRARDALRTNHMPDARPTARRVAAPDALVARYLDAFNRRDIDAIAALMHDDAVVDIVGVGEDRGRKQIRADGLSQWKVDPLPQRAETGEFAGVPVVFVFAPAEDGGERLHRIDRQTWIDGRMILSRTYFYTPEILAMVGDALGMRAERHTFRLATMT
jgi:RNA polymerase sigma-70 factor (ECF subfamily)